MRKDVLVYISGPMTATPTRSIESHTAQGVDAYLQIMKAGYPAFCPMLSGGYPSVWTALPHEAWIEYDFAILDRCTHMVLIEGWEQSKGAMREFEYAATKGMLVYRGVEALLRALPLLLLLLVPTTLYAGPLTHCLTRDAASLTFASATHIEVGVWHNDEAGCDPTNERATTTAGPYRVDYFASGAELLTFLGSAFESCGRSQADVRWRDEQGNLYRYADFIVNAGVDCLGSSNAGLGGAIGPGPGPVPFSVRGPLACPECARDNDVPTPRSAVPEPDTAAMFVLGACALALARWLGSRG